MGPDTLSILEYHTSGPFAIAEGVARAGYYGVGGVPDTYFDGIDNVLGGWDGAYDAYLNIIEGHLENPSPMNIDVEGIITPSSGYLDVDIELSEAIAELNVKVRAIVYEDNILYNNDLFRFIVRDVLPVENLEIHQAGESANYEFEFDVEEEWNEDNVGAIIFVQNDDTKEVYQSYHFTPGASLYGLEYATSENVLITDFGMPAHFLSTYGNTGSLEDTYAIELTGSAPDEWEASFMTNEEIYESYAEITLQPGEQMDLLLEIIPQTIGAEGNYTITISSLSEPLITQSIDFKVIADLPILLVDDDNGEDYETYYQAALDQYGYEYGTWENLFGGELTESEMGQFETIIWLTGNDGTTTLTESEQNKLMAYLDNGGTFFLSGQNIGPDIEGDTDFYTNYLCAEYWVNSAPGTQAVGIPGDPISDGLDLNLDGGAENQSSKDAIHALDPAVIIYDYPDFPFEAGLRVEKEGYKAVYLGFGFEGIADVSTRITLMHRIMVWLGQETKVEDADIGEVPTQFTLSQNYPNPFNPQTTIEFDIPESQDAVSLRIYDSSGKLVKTLIHAPMDAGNYSVIWNGTDDNGNAVSSGIYYYEMSTESYRQIRQLVLLK